MRTTLSLLVCLVLGAAAYAELKEVRVGGEIRIRGRYFGNTVNSGVARELRYPSLIVPKRPIGPFGMSSIYGSDSRDDDFTFIEQRAALNVRADFTGQVSTFVEFESWGRWGEDFRSDYITGVDTPSVRPDDIQIIQAYVQAEEMFGFPVRMRAGRQELVFGDAWLVGSQISPTLSMTYDALRLTWSGETYTLDAWWAKLAENMSDFARDDVDFYGLWATYHGWEPLSISGYYLLVRDDRDIEHTRFGPVLEGVENWLGLDRYRSTWLKTAGIHAKGQSRGFDYNLQLAYQWGRADAAGSLYGQTPFGVYADTRAKYDAWAGDIEAGYTFDNAWRPRIFLGGAYFSGDDNRDITFLQWLNPFDRPRASLAFNRLFSGQWYVAGLDILGGASAMTNFHQVRAGVSATPVDAITVSLSGQYLGVNDRFDWPRGFRVNGVQVPYAPMFSFWTEKGDRTLGWVGHLAVRYQYSPNLWVRVGWERVFTGDALYHGSFVLKNGHELLSGSGRDDMDYVYFDTQVTF